MPRRNRSQAPHHSPELPVEEAMYRRDQGRTRIRHTTGWAVAAAVVGTAALGAGYAYAIPGSTATHPVPAQPPAVAPSGGGSGPGAASPSAPAPATSGTPATPGHHATHAKPPATSQHPAKPSQRSGGLTPPAQPPAPTTQPPQTTTGGS